jgi:hypothetical protein
VYVIAPVTGSTVAVPWAGGVVTVTVEGSRSPSTSRSLATTSTVVGVSSAVVAASGPAVGASATAPTVTYTVALAQRPVVSQTS